MKKFIIEWLNRQGLFTFKQYAEKLDEIGALKDYAHHLEQSIDGIADPAKPIVVIGQNTNVCDVILNHGQQVIVSPYARFTCIRNVWVKSAAQAKQGE